MLNARRNPEDGELTQGRLRSGSDGRDKSQRQRQVPDSKRTNGDREESVMEDPRTKDVAKTFLCLVSGF